MKLLLLSMLATAAFSPGKTNIHAGDWSFSGRPDADCALEAGGNVLDSFGANVSLHCGADAASSMGNASYKLSANSLRQKRVTISGDIQTDNVLGASLWVKVARKEKTLMLESSADQSMYETDGRAGWVRRSVTVVVPSEATVVSFGVLLQGGGEVEVRDMRLGVSDEGAASAEAQQVLDAAIDIIKAQTADRRDIAWSALEPQVRVFAAGAEQTEEVYPAIRYLLAQLGDRRSLLLTPDLAGMFHSGYGEASHGNGALGVFALPDGAKLVLSAKFYDTRLAKVWSETNADKD